MSFKSVAKVIKKQGENNYDGNAPQNSICSLKYEIKFIKSQLIS